MFFMFFSRIALIRVRMGKNKKRPDLETSRGKSGDATHFFYIYGNLVVVVSDPQDAQRWNAH